MAAAAARGEKSNVVDIVVWVVGALFAFLAVALVSKAAKGLAKVKAEDESQKRLSAVKRRLSMVSLSPDELDIVEDTVVGDDEDASASDSEVELSIPIDTSEGGGGDLGAGKQSLIDTGTTLSTQV